METSLPLIFKKGLYMSQQTPIRNPVQDQLLTPQNAVIALIDYQLGQFDGVGSRDEGELLLNVLTLGKIARDFKIPVVLTTVGVKMGVNDGTRKELKEILGDVEEIDRTSLNSWEDEDFRSAIQKTGRKKIIVGGLWTEVCVTYPVIDALKDGFEVYPVIDAIGGVSKETHQVAVSRMVQAGAKPVTALALACELQRDWAREQGNTLRGIMRWYFHELESGKSVGYVSHDQQNATH